MDLHTLQPGYQLGEYRIEKLLGEGGFGLTYLALDTNLDKSVAIKEYMPSDFAARQDSTTVVPGQSH
jgi:serine/threonine protein kinase